MKKYYNVNGIFWCVDLNNVMTFYFGPFFGISFYGPFKVNIDSTWEEITKEELETELIKVIDLTISYL